MWKTVIEKDSILLEHMRSTPLQEAGDDLKKLCDAVKAAVAKDQFLIAPAEYLNVAYLMRDKPPESLIKVLNRHRVFNHFSFEKLRVLENYIGASDKKRLFETLFKGFKGVLRFTSFLSIAKQSLINGRDAELLQAKLLMFWRESGMSIDDVMKLLKVKNGDCTYESLETLVAYIALCTDTEPNKAYPETVKGLRKLFLNDAALKNMITKVERTLDQSSTSHIGELYGDADITSSNVEHINLANELKEELNRQVVAERNRQVVADEIDLGRLRTEILPSPDTKYKHNPGLSLDLSLAPPSA